MIKVVHYMPFGEWLGMAKLPKDIQAKFSDELPASYCDLVVKDKEKTIGFTTHTKIAAIRDEDVTLFENEYEEQVVQLIEAYEKYTEGNVEITLHVSVEAKHA